MDKMARQQALDEAVRRTMWCWPTVTRPLISWRIIDIPSWMPEYGITVEDKIRAEYRRIMAENGT